MAVEASAVAGGLYGIAASALVYGETVAGLPWLPGCVPACPERPWVGGDRAAADFADAEAAVPYPRAARHRPCAGPAVCFVHRHALDRPFGLISIHDGCVHSSGPIPPRFGQPRLRSAGRRSRECPGAAAFLSP